MPGWYAIYCRSQFERTVEAGLDRAGIENYYPFFIETRKWSDREKQIERPLFRGYVFARFRRTIQREADVRQIHGVVAILGTPADGPIKIPDKDIAVVRTLLASGLPMHEEKTPQYELGEQVVIKYGPLAGTPGRIARMKGKMRLVVTIEALNRSTSVEVDREMLQTV